MPNIITRRSFLTNAGRAAVGLGLASLMNVPPFLKRALAEGSIGLNGKKLIFVFLRGGNDGVNNIIPVLDPSYRGTGNALRNLIGLPMDPAVDYAAVTGQIDAVPIDYPYAVRAGNGFAALNPALRDLASIYNAGDLALVQRAGYRSLSQSHFDSEQYWEKGTDGVSANNKFVTNGLWYRAIVESGYNQTHALSGVSMQSNLPASLRGEQPMTNLSSISRYNTLGVYSSVNSTNIDRVKMLNALDAANLQPFPTKDNRPLVHNLGTQFRDTLDILQNPSFQANTWVETQAGNPGVLYGNGSFLFPGSQAQDQIVVSSPTGNTYRAGSSYGFMNNIRSCAQLLNGTDAIITGTEIGGWDTHTAQIKYDTANALALPHLGQHAGLQRAVAAAYYGLWRYFKLYGKGGPNEIPGAQVGWDDVVVVCMSEFGRTSEENDSMGTDHAEGSVMFVAGGGVNAGVFGCDLNTNSKLITASNPTGLNWQIGAGTKSGTLYSSNTNIGYVRRTVDYRSVLGEIIRDHLGATQNQLNRIIPAYTLESTEHLLNGGLVQTTPILGELGIVG